MKHHFCVSLLGITVAACLPATLSTESALAEENKASDAHAWTLDEVMTQLRLSPRDPYLQYIALQLARRQDKLNATSQQINILVARDDWNGPAGRRDRVDLFSIFTGALAVQESLQLDTMNGLRRPRRFPAPRNGAERAEDVRGRRLAEIVAVADLKGPTIKSHPWQKMLGDKKPDISPLARRVPEDFYFVEFRSLTRLLEAMDISDLWGTHLFNQTIRDARTAKTGDRLKEQLAVETNPLLRPFYDPVVEEAAITGSDLFVREGSDVTLLFRFKQPEVFKARMAGFLANAVKAHPDVKRTTGQYMGVAYEHLATPDRGLHVFAAYPAPDLHVRSNSRVAFQRVVEAIQGKTIQGAPVCRLGDTEEFAYIRTLMPRGAKEEDGLIYLSDPFIRRLMGPTVKLTERRRMLCYNHLCMIGHAALMYRTEHGKVPPSLEELARSGCTPGIFSEDLLVCPDGGTYRLAPDGRSGVCSHHGHAHFLTPCCEIPVKKVNGAEAEEYKDFLQEYNQYWRTYFDPIAIRVQITPERYRLETIVLPLIDNSIYSTLASTLGGKPEPLDALPVPPGNIFSLSMRFNKDGLVRNAMQRERDFKRDVARSLGLPEKEADRVKLGQVLTQGLGNQVGLHVYDARPMFDFSLPSFLGLMTGNFNGGRNVGSQELLISFLVASLNAPIYISIPAQDARIVDEFLDQLDTLLAIKARQPQGDGGWFPPFEYDFYRMPLKDRTKMARSFGLKFGPVKWRVFWARIGDGLYLASKPFILDDLIAADAERAKTGGKLVDRGPEGHAMVRLRPKNWNQVLTDYRLGWAENNREACLNNLGPLSSVGRAFTASLGKIDEAELTRVAGRIQREADQLHGVHFFCPEGGRYILAPDGKTMTCSVHGAVLAPRQPAAPSDKSSLGQLLNGFGGMTTTLTFMEDGLHAVVVLDRKK